jgi:hypothetical protein
MNVPRRHFPVILALLAGFALWMIASAATGKREPWDASVYWVAVYPLAVLSSGMLAYRSPTHATLLALAVFEGQFLGMAVRNGELGNLWPLGMVLFAIIALPAVVAARMAARRSPFRADTGAE